MECTFQVWGGNVQLLQVPRFNPGGQRVLDFSLPPLIPTWTLMISFVEDSDNLIQHKFTNTYCIQLSRWKAKTVGFSFYSGLPGSLNISNNVNSLYLFSKLQVTTQVHPISFYRPGIWYRVLFL
jgi:hypothetical protein